MKRLPTIQKLIMKFAIMAMLFIIFAPVITRLLPSTLQVSDQLCTTLGLKTINISKISPSNLINSQEILDNTRHFTMASCDYCVLITKITIILAILVFIGLLVNLSKKLCFYSNPISVLPYLGKLNCRGPPL